MKRNNLLQIKNDIEMQFENKSKNITPCELNAVVYIFNEYLIMDKVGETIQEAVANWYRKYDFIVVSERGIGWRIAYRG